MGLAAAVGVAAVGSSVVGAISSNKAANKAGQIASDNTAANNALTKEIYGENKTVLSPFVQTGTAAGSLLNDFYGITQSVQPAQAPGVASQNAFSQYLKNSDYAFQQATGNNHVNSGYAGAGTVQSGAAMKALEKYRQDLQSGYRNQWASGVANQQSVGLGAASALAGVGQNYVNTITASNTAAADARANAALRQQSVFGNALGTFAGIGLGGGFG